MAPSFRLKLLLAMMAIVATVTAATVVATQRRVEATQRRIFEDRFESEVGLFTRLQDARLAAVKRECLALARSVRLLAAMEEQDVPLLYRTAVNELRGVLRPGEEDDGGGHATFFRLVSADGAVLPPEHALAGLETTARRAPFEERIAQAARAPGRAVQEVGYLAPEIDGRPVLHEVVVTRIVDAVAGRDLGALAIGFPLDDVRAGASREHGPDGSGVLHEGRLFSRSIPEDLRPRLAAMVAAGASDDATIEVGGVPHRVYGRALQPQAPFPPTYQVGLYSMAQALAEQRELRRNILGYGAIALLIGLGVSLVISRGLAVPIRELVAGTGEIGRGNLEVRVPVRSRDEIGQLAASFNEMAGGLALKERYRGILDLVSDKRVAERLITGELALGGEQRQASVLFCDIRGFTTLTEHMAPAEVVQLLNDHMTALTRVVHAHGGVVDKYVGDALMAIFGAPNTTGDDAYQAVHAAWTMLAERGRLNAGGGHRITIGIGIASGEVLAGCMGSADRLNYTVLGRTVNLAARLSGHAAAMTVLIDEATRERSARRIAVDALPPIRLKGFSAPVAAYRVIDLSAMAPAS
jgi:class 3 adenylate cyclase